MSRLIVKNLPKSITEAKLKELFSQKGIVTDVQLKYTKDGKFRRFCFIGYKTEDEATAALEYFDKSCIDTCKIFIERCTSLGDPLKPRAWSKYALDSSYNKADSNNKNETLSMDKDSNDKQPKKEKKIKTKAGVISNNVKDVVMKHKDDPLFTEFLESHAIPNVEMLLEEDDDSKENDAVDKDEGKLETDTDNEDEKLKLANKVMSDFEYMQALKGKQLSVTDVREKKDDNKQQCHSMKLFTVIIRGLGYSHKKKHIKQFFHPLKAKSIRIPSKIKGIAYVGFKTEWDMKKALMKSKSFLEGKQIFVTKYEEIDKKSDEHIKTNESNIKWQKQQEALKDEESIAESGRLFIRNLAYTTTEDDIKKLFDKYGPLSEVDLPVDKITRKPKGFGTITFLMPEHATRAYTEQDGTILNGRMLHLLPGKSKTSLLDKCSQEGLTYKQRKELQSKANANSSYNWNTLFLGQNAVAEAIAAAYNTTKEKVLEDGTKGMSAAVKLALGETQLVQDTRNFLEENNVCLDAFNQPPEKRSKTIILVKNLPTATSVQEVRHMFVQFGELARVVMPPSGITALVEFLEPSEARKAFTKLAYTKFKHLPLYLEWAPDNSFTVSASNSKVDKVQLSLKEVEAGKSMEDVGKECKKAVSNESITKVETKTKEESESESESEPEPDTTIFVKNINFSTTEQQLKDYFSKCGPIHNVTIATKKDPKDPSNKLSMGYGFVRYKRKSDMHQAMKLLQMTQLDGKSLELKRSERTLVSDIKAARKVSKVTAQTGTKILVRNIPFQATIQEITQLFKTYGELKAVRLPLKLIGAEKHRGFGFVEYYTKTEAKKAFKTLCQSTHLYGRRLVLEWAQTDENVEDIRKRTAKHFLTESTSEMKRSKKAVLNPENVGLTEE